MAFQAKRKFPRKSGREGVRIRSSAGIEYSNYEDLSAGGLKLWLEHPMSVGEVLELEFDLPKEWKEEDRRRSMQRPARVVRCVAKDDGYEIGVQFLDFSPEFARQWTSEVDAQAGPF